MGCAASAVAGCNLVLGIEEQPSRPPAEAGVDALLGPDAPRSAFEACTRDVDCVAPNGCYTPHCDTVLGACTYALCEAKDRTCARGVCDPTTFTCSEPSPYGFLSTSYGVGGATSGCGPNPAACVAAVFPFVFLGTRDEVIALRGDDLTGTAPIKVAVAGLTTKPSQLVASGRRLWVLGEVQGTAPPYKLPLAVLDVPSDPTVTVLRAATKLVSYPFPKAVGFPAPDGGLFVALADPAQGFPAALVQAPLADDASLELATAADAGATDASAADSGAGAAPAPGVIAMYRASGVPAGSALVAASGDRLVLHRLPSTFNLVSAAGTARVAVQPEATLVAPLVPLGAATFAQGPDGTVTMAAAVVADPAGDCNCTTHARLQFVFPNAASTATDVNQLVDVETYTNPLVTGSACHVCTADYFRPRLLATWLDRRSALTAAPLSGPTESRTLTDVRLVGRDPLESNVKRRAQTRATDTPKGDFAVDRIALTSSNGIGYLVLADSQGNDVSLSIYDPRCDAR
jgi:hypothetical protein